MSTSLGKFRHLTQSSTSAGHFVVLAIDHRANLLDSLNKHSPTPITDHEFRQFKLQVMKHLLPSASAVLTDPAYGIGPGITEGVINGQVGILAPLEITNYDVHPSRRMTQFIKDWSVAKIKRVGGTGVKLLLYYHPGDSVASEKRNLVSQIVEQCGYHDIPLYLEPIAYSLDTQRPLDKLELRQIVVESARTFSALGVDILKLEFPVNPLQETDEAAWLSACQEVDAACKVPWTILSAGTNYETFRRQAIIACQSGASGVIVGRSVWSEAVELQGDQRAHFLQTVARQRMEDLSHVCTTCATDWHSKISLPQSTPVWYETYGNE
jgi:tagatose 1,6-diphosphate aldolase